MTAPAATSPFLAPFWPAGTAFQNDRRRTPEITRLFEYLAVRLDFREIRELKISGIAVELGARRDDTSKRLALLAEWGYVIVAKPGPRGQWRATLAWSLG